MFDFIFSSWWVILIIAILIIGVVRLDLKTFEKLEERIREEKKNS
jgi:cytochrome c biogenesis protein ResB